MRYLQEETPLHIGWSGTPLSESASRYSRYSSNFLSHVLIRTNMYIHTRIFVYFFWSIARLGDAPLADGRIRVSHAYPEV